MWIFLLIYPKFLTLFLFSKSIDFFDSNNPIKKFIEKRNGYLRTNGMNKSNSVPSFRPKSHRLKVEESL